MENLLSYTNILNDTLQFKKSGTKSGRDFNILDTPSHKYFKIMFYFGSATEFDDGENGGSGLLAPTWDYIIDEKYYEHNSAWSFLKLNDENERAEKLEHFITLLSDISSNSPWYFTSVGLGEALERKPVDDGKLEIANKKLTITCLPDAMDNRIGTLLELYRDVTWSWIHKKEIIPSNLRKFDMAIYIFESPVDGWNTNVLDCNSYNIWPNIDKSKYTYYDTIIGYNNHKDFNPKQFNVSYKMLEFHDCEFGYNSIKSGLNELNNQTGFSPTYTIDINYSDCYEISYNDVMMRTIGDVILTDLVNNSSNSDDYISMAQEDSSQIKSQCDFNMRPKDSNKKLREEPLHKNLKTDTTNSISDHLENINPFKGFLQNAVGQVAGHIVKEVKSKVNRALLGNIYGLSLTQIGTQLKELAQGNIIKSAITIKQYKEEKSNREKQTPPADGNIFEGATVKTIFKSPNRNIFKDVAIQNTPTKLGNTFKNSTIANN